MTITVRVKPLARKNAVAPLAPGTFLVSVTAPPADGKANEMVIKLLSEFFRKPRRSISILRGAASRQKLVRID